MIGLTVLDANKIPLPDLLDDNGLMKLLPRRHYADISKDALRLWCHVHARYGLPTVELIDWLRQEIGTRKAIEIGAGHGDLAHHLGIPATDNWSQYFPEIKRFYASIAQPTIQYPSWVECLDAAEAMQKHRPRVVIASWVTQWVDPDLPPPDGGGSIYGVKEDEIVASGVTYILIGNISVHGKKKIMERPHVVEAPSWLRSRSVFPNLDRIWIWNR